MLSLQASLLLSVFCNLGQEISSMLFAPCPSPAFADNAENKRENRTSQAGKK
jgi:hypothetical protein